MAFRFDFFEDGGSTSTTEGKEKRSGDDLTLVLGHISQGTASLPTGCLGFEDVQHLPTTPKTKEIDKHSLPGEVVVHTLNGGSLSQSDDIAKCTDVLPGRYEGGLKIWECSFDAIACLSKFSPPPQVLDLGCGAGLVGIWALKFWPATHVAFHDLNRSVLERATIPNIELNGADLLQRSSFFYGPWSSSYELQNASFDLITTADTLYDPETIPILLEIMLRVLRPGGKAIIAAKRFYFGVGGGVSTFISIASKRGGCTTQVLASFQDGVSNIRDVLELTKSE